MQKFLLFCEITQFISSGHCRQKISENNKIMDVDYSEITA